MLPSREVTWLVGVGLGGDGRGEVGGLGWLAGPAGGHLPRSWAGSPGSILVSAAGAGQRVDRGPGCGGPGGREVGQCVLPGLGRRMMRADDAAGERGGPAGEQGAGRPPVPAWNRVHWASGNGACRFTASIWSGWAVVMSSRRLEMAQPGVAGQHGASTSRA